ncbi:MAG: hypothetical protein RI940_447, partial [Bacteroidota bacterium]
LLCSILILCMFSFGYSQANVSSTGISIQGIARDNTNNALANQTNFPVVVSIFTGAGTNEKTLITQNANVNTDDWGVFSYTLPVTSADFFTISNNECWVRITNNNNVFVQEQLRAVPYAIQAQNGVPTGAIMAYLGSTAPSGWMLADGSAIPQTDSVYSKLKAIYGTNVPNLKGLFLRGTGTNGTTSTYVGPSLKATQADSYKAHTHPLTISGTTSNNGAHSHDARWFRDGSGIGALPNPIDALDGNNPDGAARTMTRASGSHAHSLTVNVNTSSTIQSTIATSTETRPANYGVNYIIKI